MNQKYMIPVEELDLSTRSTQILRRNQIDTIEKLMSLTDLDLLRLQNLGPKTLQEIKIHLHYVLYEKEKEPESPIAYGDLVLFSTPFHWSRKTRFYAKREESTGYIHVSSVNPEGKIPRWHCWMYLEEEHKRFSGKTLEELCQRGREKYGIALDEYTYQRYD